MKNLLLALMLVIMGQRWENVGEGFWIAQKCLSSGELSVCTEGPNYYRLVYVVGVFSPWPTCSGMGPCGDLNEKFTVAVPNTPTKAMSKEEAEKLNQGLMR